MVSSQSKNLIYQAHQQHASHTGPSGHSYYLWDLPQSCLYARFPAVQCAALLAGHASINRTATVGTEEITFWCHHLRKLTLHPKGSGRAVAQAADPCFETTLLGRADRLTLLWCKDNVGTRLQLCQSFLTVTRYRSRPQPLNPMYVLHAMGQLKPGHTTISCSIVEAPS
eukprot:GHUV01043706.1.p1 GENE.GHUV01043706.1~~GHUV01043706.1.p1  ORF type:complete len:180 (+),score=14.98 GHUV01043706.1:34-540(+)